MSTPRIFSISTRETRAVIAGNGTLHSLKIKGGEYLGFPGQYAAGDVLIPFPNRVEDGRYRFDDVNYQLAITEPERGNAIAGLVWNRDWMLQGIGGSQSQVTLEVSLDGSDTGYPFQLRVSVTYRVSEDGIEVATEATNVGDRAAPYGAGYHPYLRIPGISSIDECWLRIPAETYLPVNERMIPLPAVPVAGTSYDFRESRRIGETPMDTCFTGFTTKDGLTHIELGDGGGRRGITLYMAPPLDYLQVFTGDTLPEGRRSAIALEPQTCAPNAFNNGSGLIRLEPGERSRSMWGLRIIA
jgi:aldose 1-epimerase